jgi:hypothetical protein
VKCGQAINKQYITGKVAFLHQCRQVDFSGKLGFLAHAGKCRPGKVTAGQAGIGQLPPHRILTILQL